MCNTRKILCYNTDYNFVTNEIGEYRMFCEREMSADRSCKSEVQIRYSWEERMRGDPFWK